ncbi:hypothetical protein [Streptomyces sp. NPDC051684]|uniref:hypothetical protein n=1 Tax=Streptomyces sp. NPDC051684 TaxID=3365670 RepID=UPI00379789E1
MALITEYGDYLEEFRSEVVDGLASDLTDRGATLRDLAFSEDEDGVWVESIVDLPNQQEPWVRRRLIIPAQGPDKDAWLAGVIFASAVNEELDTSH